MLTSRKIDLLILFWINTQLCSEELSNNNLAMPKDSHAREKHKLRISYENNGKAPISYLKHSFFFSRGSNLTLLWIHCVLKITGSRSHNTFAGVVQKKIVPAFFLRNYHKLYITRNVINCKDSGKKSITLAMPSVRRKRLQKGKRSTVILLN